ncbi:glutamate-1-semialdehyde 2,1-aminomutase [Konateibacter massiliensis]|uniref:glutamate-1-semialdehyde 2,1-aminomutase n=1 Tax=Konateibacter massiliensis TaxID=2002841 RepID=UPI000C14572F|nr:glutamate-1-semialdehyde 2,1-aminomutase [Konateibacter massiliensis]
MTKSEQLYEEARNYIPGGVNSPVRAYGSVGLTPRFIAKADGAYITDVDGKEYIDFIGSWGPMILGSNHKAVYEKVVEACKNGLSFGAATEYEVKMAKLICELVPSIEMIRMVNSGTEAVMSAIRVARGFTGRNKIVKFEGCYHGHSDSMLVKAGSGVMTAGVPDSAGVPKGCATDTLTAGYNDLASVEELFEQWGEDIAAIIIEPVAANMGVVLPEKGFLEGLRKICDENQTLLIFDEVITGFRLGIDGAQGYFGIKPDLTTFGKIIGGGMPVGAYGGRRDIMEMVAPLGTVYQAGTLSGNPVAMAAGYAQLTMLKDNSSFYEELNKKAQKLFEGMKEILKEKKVDATLNYTGSLGCIFFTKEPVRDYTTAKTADTKKFGEYFKHMLENGIYIAPSQFEAMFVSGAMTDKEVEETLRVFEQTITKISR